MQEWEAGPNKRHGRKKLDGGLHLQGPFGLLLFGLTRPYEKD